MQSCDQEQHSLFPSIFNDFEVGSKTEGPILLEKMENKENLLPKTTPVYEG